MKRIEFIEKNVAALCDTPRIEPGAGEICVRTCYTAISAGTEKANLTGEENVSGARTNVPPPFPRICGYSESGIVESVGPGVTDLKPGDRVVSFWGKHAQYNTLPRENVVKIEHDNIDLKEACMIFISTFSLAAVRKMRMELGESCMVVGLGLLGMFAVQYAALSGAMPVIAVASNPQRLELAKKLGADYCINYREGDYAEKVKALTGGKGVDSIIEVTGQGSALNNSLLCAADFARVALLGCTRDPSTVDFYHDVHYPGVSLIGAHTLARPKLESRPGCWTHQDDCRAALAYLAKGRLNIRDMISEVHSPADAPEVFNRLAFDRNFPLGVVFDWNKL